MTWTRREVLRLIGAAGVTLASGAGCKSSGAHVLSDAERRALAALADAVLPPDGEPGGAALGTVAYVERLLTAFDGAIPAIFAAGPYSGRQPFADGSGQPSSRAPANDFAGLVELDRFSAAAWRLRLFGSSALPAGAPNQSILGAVVGLRDQLRQGLAAAIAANRKPLDRQSPAELATSFNYLDPPFQSLLVDLVSEAAFAAPEYGGNPGGAGWRLCHFEGDSQPLGYSQWNGTTFVERPAAPLSTANPGADPAPLDARVRATLDIVVSVLGGRTW